MQSHEFIHMKKDKNKKWINCINQHYMEEQSTNHISKRNLMEKNSSKKKLEFKKKNSLTFPGFPGFP